MKKKLSLILAVVMIVALFAACGGGGGSTTTNPPAATSTASGGSAATNPPAGGGTETQAPAETSSDYNMAPADWAVDARGLPLAAYDYTLPISTTDEVLQYWTTSWTMQYVDTETLAEMPYQAGLEERTGIHIEYIIIPSDQRSTNMSVLLAGDDLPDAMGQAHAFYPGTAINSIEEGYFVNLYDYKQYLPNYLYQVKRYESNRDVYDNVFYDDSTILSIGFMLENPMPGMGYGARADWLERLNIDPASVVTYDDITNMLSLFKTEIGAEWPVALFSAIELQGGALASGYNTMAVISTTTAALPVTRRIGNELAYTLTMEEDRDFMALLNQWYSSGFISPDWGSYANTQELMPLITTGVVGYLAFNPGELPGIESTSTDPNARWAALSRPRQTADQILKFGQKNSPGGGGFGAAISSNCDNIPLMISWFDWMYSVEGSLYVSWGVEDLSWYYDENGNRMLTDFILTHPLGAAWAMCLYAMNGLCDPGLQHHLRSYAYPGGDRYVEMMAEIWYEHVYYAEYDVPRSFRLTQEESDEVRTYTTDVGTYISENYLQFLDGSKPMSEWDSYVKAIMDMGLARCLEINNTAFARWREAYE